MRTVPLKKYLIAVRGSRRVVEDGPGEGGEERHWASTRRDPERKPDDVGVLIQLRILRLLHRNRHEESGMRLERLSRILADRHLRGRALGRAVSLCSGGGQPSFERVLQLALYVLELEVADMCETLKVKELEKYERCFGDDTVSVVLARTLQRVLPDLPSEVSAPEPRLRLNQLVESSSFRAIVAAASERGEARVSKSRPPPPLA